MTAADFVIDEGTRAQRDKSEGSEERGASLASLAYVAGATWPKLEPRALHGPIGDYVRAAAPYTEADPAAVLVSTLVAFGVAAGRGPHVVAGNDRHPPALYVAVVGDTSRAAKGTSRAVARPVIERADPDIASRTLGGFGSGEALVDAVRDPMDEEDTDAPLDTRALIFESELGRVLSTIGRQGSILGSLLRTGWDGQRLEVRTRGRGAVVATRYHLGALAHITAEELRTALTSTEIYGGTGNRFLWACARRSRLLPDGGNVPEDVIDKAAGILADALDRTGTREMHRTPAATDLWHSIYRDLADDDPGGLVGALTARAAPQCLRLSLVYALADGSSAIDIEHVQAAYALWNYSRASVAWVFGDRTGDEVADKILDAVRAAGADGLDRTSLVDLFGRHVGKARIDLALDRLRERGKVGMRTEETGGRPRSIVVARAAL